MHLNDICWSFLSGTHLEPQNISFAPHGKSREDEHLMTLEIRAVHALSCPIALNGFDQNKSRKPDLLLLSEVVSTASYYTKFWAQIKDGLDQALR